MDIAEPENVQNPELERSSLEIEVTKDEVAASPGDTGDPASIVEAKIPTKIRERYEVYSYRNAAVILSETRQIEFGELIETLNNFSITKEMIRKAGGNESEIPKLLSTSLRPKGWYETIVQADLQVRRIWSQPRLKNGQIVLKKGRPEFEKKSSTMMRERYLDGHKIDYVKDRVAFDLEWNSKDQTFDRDLYAFSAFFQCRVIDVGVLVTRGTSMNKVFPRLGQALKRDGTPEFKEGVPRLTREKFGASTTWMGKLLYRLNAGRNGGCPVLAIGITPKCISDWTPEDEHAVEGETDEPPADSEED